MGAAAFVAPYLLEATQRFLLAAARLSVPPLLAARLLFARRFVAIFGHARYAGRSAL